MPGWSRFDNELRNRIREIGATAWAVYCVLLTYCDRSMECFPSTKTIAADLGVCRRCVQVAIRTLAAAGMLSIEPRQDSTGAWTASTYRVLGVPPQEPCESTCASASGCAPAHVGAPPAHVGAPNGARTCARTRTIDPDPTNKTARTQFARPTIDEVRAYCTERGRGVDADQWYSHYTANGWKVGRNPMRDWRAAVRTWEKNGVGTNGHTQRHVAASPARIRRGVPIPDRTWHPPADADP